MNLIGGWRQKLWRQQKLATNLSGAPFGIRDAVAVKPVRHKIRVVGYDLDWFHYCVGRYVGFKSLCLVCRQLFHAQVVETIHSYVGPRLPNRGQEAL